VTDNPQAIHLSLLIVIRNESVRILEPFLGLITSAHCAISRQNPTHIIPRDLCVRQHQVQYTLHDRCCPLGFSLAFYQHRRNLADSHSRCQEIENGAD
jgi:hypothetical protein